MPSSALKKKIGKRPSKITKLYQYISKTNAKDRHLHPFPTRRSSDLLMSRKIILIKQELLLRVYELNRSGLLAVNEKILPILAQLEKLLLCDSSPLRLDRKSGSAGMPRPISYAVFCFKKKNRKETQQDHQTISIYKQNKRQRPTSTPFPYTTLFRSSDESKNYLDKAGITTACLRIKSKWTAGGK